GARSRPGEQRHDADPQLLGRAGGPGGGRLGGRGWRQNGDQRDHAQQRRLHHARSLGGGLSARNAGRIAGRGVSVKHPIALKRIVTEKEVDASKPVLPNAPERRRRDRTSASGVRRGSARAVSGRRQAREGPDSRRVLPHDTLSPQDRDPTAGGFRGPHGPTPRPAPPVWAGPAATPRARVAGE